MLPSDQEYESTASGSMLPSDPSTSFNRLTVLIVDDQDSVDLLALLLQLEGATVITAVSFCEAIEILDRCRPDLLITSLCLPDADGYLLLDYLRMLEAEQGEPPIAAVAVVESLRELTPSQIHSGGFQSYLTKPLIPLSVLNVVANLTGCQLHDLSQLSARRNL